MAERNRVSFGDSTTPPSLARPTVWQEIMNAVEEYDPNFVFQGKTEDDQTYLKRICRNISEMPDKLWNRLSEEYAQAWYNEAAEAFRDDSLIELPEGYKSPSNPPPAPPTAVEEIADRLEAKRASAMRKADKEPEPVVEAEPEVVASEPEEAAKHVYPVEEFLGDEIPYSDTVYTNGAAHPEEAISEPAEATQASPAVEPVTEAPKKRRGRPPGKGSQKPKEPKVARPRGAPTGPRAGGGGVTHAIRSFLVMNPDASTDDIRGHLKTLNMEPPDGTISTTRQMTLQTIVAVKQAGRWKE